MQTAWYFLIALMFTAYVVLDGFDLGAGLMSTIAAKSDEDRRTILAAIGPVWDANEVWLIAAGGVLVFAFPKVYAAAFSGFYLPLMIVLWLLVLRGISIEFRSRVENPLWRRFWDAVFTLSSTALALVLGISLGNVVRGVPLELNGYFHISLFEDFRPWPHPGAIDWYTGLIGVFAVVVLGAHGALYLNWKTTGALRQRCEHLAFRWCIASFLLGVLGTAATATVQPLVFSRLADRPWTWPLALAVIAGMAASLVALRRHRELFAFATWALFIAALLLATAAVLYPDILRSSLDPTATLTAFNASTGEKGLAVGLQWWIPAIALAISYFTYLFRSFRSKVTLTDSHY